MILGQFDVEFTKNGSVHDEQQVDAFLNSSANASGLVVLSHGWNNDTREANDLYDAFIASLDQLSQPPASAGAKLIVMRVFWPSKKFADNELIPGGGVASAHFENDMALLKAL